LKSWWGVLRNPKENPKGNPLRTLQNGFESCKRIGEVYYKMNTTTETETKMNTYYIGTRRNWTDHPEMCFKIWTTNIKPRKTRNNIICYKERTTDTFIKPDGDTQKVDDMDERLLLFSARKYERFRGNKTYYLVMFDRFVIDKEDLVKAVFHPNRLERMVETYGQDWMDNV